MGFGLGVLLAPGHGAEADSRNVQIRAGEIFVLHEALRLPGKGASVAEKTVTGDR